MDGGEGDRNLTCLDCEASFVISGNEQTFYRERGFREPTYCADCRARRRSERNAELIATHDARGTSATLEHGTYGGQSHNIGHPPRAGFARGGGGGGPRQLYPAICAACGTDTRIPFAPRGDRPVFCRDCFNARRGR